jgi:hypothetical protein
MKLQCPACRVKLGFKQVQLPGSMVVCARCQALLQVPNTRDDVALGILVKEGATPAVPTVPIAPPADDIPVVPIAPVSDLPTATPVTPEIPTATPVQPEIPIAQPVVPTAKPVDSNEIPRRRPPRRPRRDRR